MKNTTNYTPITKNTTVFAGNDDIGSVLLDDSVVTLDSLVYCLHGYSTINPPNQYNTKDSVAFTNISKPLTSYS